MTNSPHPDGLFGNHRLCTTSGNVPLVTVSFRRRLKRETKQRCAIDGMHILVILLGYVDSMLYLVFATDCKQRIGLFTLALRSNHSVYTLHVHVIESHESTPSDWQSSLIRIEVWPDHEIMKFMEK